MAAGQAPVPSARRVAVFIDADNLNDATALDHVFSELHQRGERVVYKRAYGRTESLRAIDAVLSRHGVRPVANMVVRKVTTDIALVIDAVEAVCSGAIDSLVLCSGDADFVPLATWAREKGCQVLCFSLANKIFANPEGFFDEVVLLELVEQLEPSGPLQEAAAAIATAAESAALAGRLAPCSPALAGSTSDSAPSVPSTTGAPSAPSILDGALEGTVQQVLAAFPALRTGQPQHLGQVVAALRQQGILGKTTKTTAWFAHWGTVFELTPQPVAHQIVYHQRTEQKPRVPAVPALPAPLAPPAAARPQPATPPVVALEPVALVEPFALRSVRPGSPAQAPELPVPVLQKACLAPASVQRAVRAPLLALASLPLPLPPEVQRILHAVPALRHSPQMLSQLVPVLRQQNILGKTARSTPFFLPLAAWFQLRPAHQPTQVVYLPPGTAAQTHGRPPAPTASKAATTAVAATAVATAPQVFPLVLSWPTQAGRRPAPPLPEALQGLRQVLLQRALRGVCVADVLLAVPELLQGQPCALSAVAGRLRERGLLHASQSALRILERYPRAFQAVPSCAPQTVVYLR